MTKLAHPRKKLGAREVPANLVKKTALKSQANSITTNESPKGKMPAPSRRTASPKKKSQIEIDDIAKFLTYAYSRKGQRVAISAKVKKALHANYNFHEKSRTRLREIAKDDALLAVPRQILLSARKANVSRNLKNSILNFVGDVMKQHPAFSIPEVEQVFSRSVHSTDPGGVLTALGAINYSKLPGIDNGKQFKPKDYNVLKYNIIYLLTIWFVETRGLSAEKLVPHIFSALWQPQALATKDDTERLQILTDIRELAGVGIACLSFKKQADRQMKITEITERKFESLSVQLREAKGSTEKSQQGVRVLEKRITELITALDIEKQAHDNARIHLGDDLESFRTRVVRRLKSEVKLLDEGLHALRDNPPKIWIIEDHVERVIDGLKKELREATSDE